MASNILQLPTVALDDLGVPWYHDFSGLLKRSGTDAIQDVIDGICPPKKNNLPTFLSSLRLLYPPCFQEITIRIIPPCIQYIPNILSNRKYPLDV